MEVTWPTFQELISHRGFDAFYKNGLKSRFNAWRVRHQLTYGGDADNPSFRLTLEDDEHTYALVLWESGDCIVTAKQMRAGVTVVEECFHFGSTSEFFETYPKTVTQLFGFGKRGITSR